VPLCLHRLSIEVAPVADLERLAGLVREMMRSFLLMSRRQWFTRSTGQRRCSTERARKHLVRMRGRLDFMVRYKLSTAELARGCLNDPAWDRTSRRITIR
jgi:hypothetical protein